jgi:pilus assembly protein FimV
MILTTPFLSTTCLRTGSVPWAVAVSIALLCWPAESDALSLGRSRGAAVLGRTLDVSVLATLEPQESVPDATCFSAEVFYGDTRVGAQNVTVTPLRTSASELTLRVRSNAPVDEPFVTLYVRTACGPSLARRYVLLSDAPSEQAPAVQAPVVPVLPAPPRASGSATPSASGGESGEAVPASPSTNRTTSRPAQSAPLDPAALARAQQRREARALAKEQAQALAQERAAARAPAPERSAMSPMLGSSTKTNPGRLKVDLLDFAPGRDPSLRSSTELLTQPTADPQARAMAAAMWRAISASPQDLLRDVERLKTIEAEVRAMSELTKRQTQELVTLKSDLDKAKREQYANPFVYGLGALALAALALAAWLWRRSKSASAPWWGGSDSAQTRTERATAKSSRPARINVHESSASIDADNERELGFVAASQLVTPPSSPMPLDMRLSSSSPTFIPRTQPGAGFDISMRSSSAGLSDTTPMSGTGLKSRRDREGAVSGFDAGSPAALRPVNAEELFDIQQQADFFMSLGQHEQAIDILQNHISDNVETSAVAYLDLFDIYHKVGQREDFAALRDEFNRVFNAQVPEFDQYGLNSRGLEEYSTAIERIQALWPNSKVLEVIEESIFRKPDRDNQPFDLLAYRELMLLYAVAKDVSEFDSVRGDLGVDFDTSMPAGLSAAVMADMGMPVSNTGYGGGFSGTEVQPLNMAMASSAFDRTLKDVPVDEWEEALKNLPLVSKQNGADVDIDLELFEDSAAPPQPVLKPAEKPVTPPDDNSIDFDAATERDFRPSRPSKL